MPSAPAHEPVCHTTGTWLPALLCACLLTGCQTMAPEQWRIQKGSAPARVTVRSTLDADDLFAYTQHLLTLSRDSLAEEILLRRAAAQAEHKPLDRAKLALALTMPNQNQRDTTKALVAITDAPRDSAQVGGPASTMLNYVEVLLAWQARQEENLQSVLQSERPANTADPAGLQGLAQRLRNDLHRNEAQVEALTQKLRDEKARADNLQQKLDALTNLEKSLAERKSPRSDGPR